MTCPSRASAPVKAGEPGAAGGRRLSLRTCIAVAAAIAALSADCAFAADWPGESPLRGSFFSAATSRWDGVNFGVQYGASNMNTDFSNASAPIVANLLRNSLLEQQFAPSQWTTLSSATSNGRQYGAFLGYAWQWDQLVVGIDGAYNRASNLQTSSSDGLRRIVTTSDSPTNIQHDVTITAQSSIELVDYATLRARLGYAMGQFLPYVTVGGAVGRFNYSNMAHVFDVQTPAQPGTPFDQTGADAKNNAIVGGFTTGLGVDVALLPNVFLRAEWEYVAFAQVSGIRTTINTGRVGVGVRF